MFSVNQPISQRDGFSLGIIVEAAMWWKNQRISVKLGIGFGSLLVMVMLIGIWTVIGVQGILGDAAQVITGNRLDAQLAQIELDHLNQIKKVNLMLTNQSASHQEIADEGQCALGQWLNGQARREAESIVPTFEPEIEALERTHDELHRSFKSVRQIFRRADETLPATLLACEIGLLDWSGQIRETFIKFQSTLPVTTDPTQDVIGAWLNAKETGHLYERSSVDVKKGLGTLRDAHAQLFKSAAAIAADLSEAQNDPSLYLDARKTFETQALGQVQTTLAALRELKKTAQQELSGIIAARQLFAQQTEPASVRIQEHFGRLRQELKTALVSDVQLLGRAATTRSVVIVLAVVAVMGGILLAAMISVAIVRPLRTGSAFAGAMAKGNLKVRLDLEQRDEIGNLANALNSMANNFETMLAEISRGILTLSSTSGELSATSREMAQGAEKSAARTNTVAASAEQVGANISVVASASEQAADNIGIVSSASEEMSATINEIAKNTATAREISAEAMNQSRKCSQQISELGHAAKKIDTVLGTITEISEQVNLLALNATIEAARAGEAGRGFTVVANEIKELAHQTASASATIKHQIAQIRESIQATVGGIGSIGAVVARVNEIVEGIAAATEEQSATSREIADNVARAAEGIKAVNAKITQSSTASNHIAVEIAQVGRTADAIAGSSSRVDQSARQLTHLSEQLKEMVGRFSL
jgi:methyl-accepting chemotaxis protein